MTFNKREKVLIIRLSALGDVAMTLPVIYSVCQAFPDTEFFLLTRPFFSKIFVNRPKNLYFITPDLKNDYKGIGGMLKLLKSLSGYGFTKVADLHNVMRSWVIDAFFRAKGAKVNMLDKARGKRKSANKRKECQRNFIDRYCDVFNELGFSFNLEFRSVFDNDSTCHSTGISHPSVGIAPFARYYNKTYPIEMMEKVVEGLTKQDINVYLFGAGGKESDILGKWAERYTHCRSLAGQMPIDEELAMMSQMDVMISMDSANQHLASITGTKVLSIWGSTAPSCGFMAYGQSEDNAILANLDCQPCTTAGSKECRLGTLACLKNISPEFIVESIRHVLRSKK